jgi:hypothetical protein
MHDEMTEAGFRIWMKSMVEEKAEFLRQDPPRGKALKTIRRWRRGLIEAYHAGFCGYPAVEAEVRKIARANGAGLYEGPEMSRQD